MKIIAKGSYSHECAIVMPVYNEQDVIEKVVEQWCGVAREINGMVLVINDGSTDRTLEILQDAQNKYPEMVIIDKHNEGHGKTCMVGYRWAVEKGFEWIFQTDTDGQTDPGQFLEIWQIRKKHDFIWGLRRIRRDGLARWFVTGFLRLVILCTFCGWVPDANVPFRLMNTNRLKPFLDRIPSDLSLENAFLTILLQKSGCSIHWFPIRFGKRAGGIPSVTSFKFFSVGRRVAAEFWKYRRINEN